VTTSEEVYLLDANVLLALTNPSHVHHAASQRWLRTVSSWATTPMTEVALIRLLLNPAVVGQYISRAEAIGVVRRLREQPAASFIADATTLAEPSVEMSGLVGPKQVTDFHLVNLAAATGAVLATFDARIPAYLSPRDHEHVRVLDG
jgi:toxin-antitoxin system PIN domain toxin